MTTGEKIYTCRKNAGMTQEELADRVGVTRQAVSRWEQDVTFPETKQIMELCKLFGLTADELLFGTEGAGATDAKTEPACRERQEGAHGEQKDVRPPSEDGRGTTWGVIDHGRPWRFEYISKRRLFGVPLLHVNLGGRCRARGIFAVGIFATGFVSVGVFALGLLSLGVFALGLFAFGAGALGGLACGSVAAGVLAVAGIAVGIWTFGGIAVGFVAVGGLAVGQFAVGDWASGWLSVGLSHAQGTHAFLLPEAFEELSAFLSAHVSGGLGAFVRAVASVLRR